MLRFHSSRFIWVLALILGIWMVGSQAQEYRYHYVSLSQAASDLGIDPSKITNSGRVYGTVWNKDSCPNIFVYEKGFLTMLQAGKAYDATESGKIGGGVRASENVPCQVYKAALFHGKKVEYPSLEGETFSYVTRLSDSGIALIRSSKGFYVLYQNGDKILIPNDLQVSVRRKGAQINNEGLIIGTKGDQAFLLNLRSGELTLLNPLSPATPSWGKDINNRGDVLGYSFGTFNVPTLIGVWSNQGQFEIYFNEDDKGFVSNELCFNDNNLIVISAINPPYQVDNGKVYLVPKPGVLLNLADLVDEEGSKQLQSFTSVVIRDVNNHGDMIGCGYNPDYGPSFCRRDQVFLLERVDHGKSLK